ncbi:hypothetical protein WA158_002075 [Blastocystis sp. Blastoise]
MGNCLSNTMIQPHKKVEDECAVPTGLPPVPPGVTRDLIVSTDGDKNPRKWTVPKVLDWLQLIGLGQYASAFKENGVDGETIVDLEESEIESTLTISDPLHQLSLNKAITLLTEEPEIDYHSWRWSLDGVLQWLDNRGLSLLKPVFKTSAVHGAVLFSLTEEDFSQKYKIGSQYGTKMHLASLLSAIKYEKKKAITNGPKIHFASTIHKGTFGEDGGQEALAELTDPIGDTDRTNLVPEWGLDEVCTWVNDHYLGHLCKSFRENSVHGAFLLELDKDLLEQEIHLTPVQAKVLYKEILKLKDLYECGATIVLGTNKENKTENFNKTLIDEDEEEDIEDIGELPVGKFMDQVNVKKSRHTIF